MRKHGAVDGHNSRAFSLRAKKSRARSKAAKRARRAQR